jgi:hypothetical protein
VTARPPAAGWNGPVTWQARGLWPPGPGVSRRGRAPIDRVGPGPGIWSAGAGTRQAQSPGGLAAYGVGVTLCLKRHGHVTADGQFIYVYSFMRIRHLGFFLIDLFSDYQTDRQTFLPGKPLLWLCRHN